MTKTDSITRGQFRRKFAGKQLSVEELRRNKKLKATIDRAGQQRSVKDLTAADIDDNGEIEGRDEVDLLFTQLDHYYDKNGDRGSIALKLPGGGTSTPGEIYSQLQFLAQQGDEPEPVKSAPHVGLTSKITSREALEAKGKEIAIAGGAHAKQLVNRHQESFDQTGLSTHYGTDMRFTRYLPRRRKRTSRGSSSSRRRAARAPASPR